MNDLSRDIETRIDGNMQTQTAPTADAWNTLIKNRFGSVRAEPRQFQGFRGMISQMDAGGVSMVQCTSSPARVSHDPTLVAPSIDAGFIIKTQIVGSMRISAGPQTITLNPGDYVICDNSRPYNLDFAEETTIISIPLSAEYLSNYSPFPEDISFIAVSNNNPIRRIAYDYLESLWRNNYGAMSDFARAKLASTFLELAVLSISDQRQANASRRLSHRELFNRCAAFITQHIHDEALNPAMIAAANGISLRHLQTVFAARDTTVRDYIAHIRMDTALKLLQSNAYNGRTVSEIAYSLGYRSLASFSRSFKTRFAMSPTDLREKSQRPNILG